MVTIAVLVAVGFITRTLNQSIEVNQNISETFIPSSNGLSEMADLIVSSKMLIKNWVYIDKKENTPDKLKLVDLHSNEFPDLNNDLLMLSEKWPVEEQERYKNISQTIEDTLFRMHQDIMDQLNNFEAYNDPFLLWDITPMLESDGEIISLSDSIISNLNNLADLQQLKVEQARINMDESFGQLRKNINIMGIVLVLLSIATAIYLSRMIIARIKSVNKILQRMGNGILPDQDIKEGNDEIGEMSASLNNLVHGLKDITKFSVEIGNGNFDSIFTPLSEDDDLGNALLDMRNSLKKATEEEQKRKKEDEQRNWASNGIANFSDLLRQNNDNIEELSYSIISNLVKYTDANQGGLFVINDDDESEKFIELKAAFAFNKKKFIDKKIEMGVGLIGRCVQESETIFMTEIPNDYIQITSGLGDDNPKCLLIVPLITNEIVYGVIELASFKVFEKYQIEFIERIGENIAATLSSVKTSIKTNQLLERTQQQAEQMRSQEEEMRQNMEELQATQEESARREKELEKKVAEFERLKKEQEKLIKKLGGDKLKGNLLDM